MDFTLPVSGREFARMVGLSEGAVRKAIAADSIVDGRTPEGKIIPYIAAREWGKEFDIDYIKGVDIKRQKKKKELPPKVVRVKPVIEKKDEPVPVKKIKPAPVKKTKPIKEKPIPITADDFLDEDDDLPEISNDELNEADLPFNEKSSKREADRRQAIYKAKMAELAYSERKGEMIPFAKLDKLLFGYGSEIRATFEALPAQVIDKIRACNDRPEALRVLQDAVHDALNLLTDIQSREI